MEILCERLSLPEFRIVESATPNHRRLCLHVCGLGLPDQQLKQTVNELVQNGENIKAAALAISKSYL